ncbi:endonuclease/exonuclease/phosphatase family protein [Arcanobacterium phocisimile]|uniref:Endonuclease/exonuclease/phosphatase family protein n=1 Tax=Arcanobacterium phocisimile TaxID=1302235 RepID=A0ABX7IIC8_9ACTO|nr:endonuclease/exonuclease/phosphatase family protein [Arcanobacterium phocisimile]QRV02289.1 endonuclease/exonuclease/phosphatase family protein [Arcanobacterium phocisimile]
MKYFWGLLSFVIAACAAILIRPDLLSFSRDFVLSTPLAQIMSLRVWIAGGLLFAAVALFVFSVVRRKLLGMGRIAAVLGAVLLIFSGIQFGMIAERGISNPGKLGPDRGVSLSSSGNGDITVLTYNTLGGRTGMADVSQLAVSNGADVIVLPETSSAHGQELVDALRESGLDFQQFDTHTSEYDPEFRSTVLLVSRGLGEYEQADIVPDSAAGVSARPVSGQGPVFVGVHPIAPLPALIDEWRSETRSVYSVCSEPNFIMAGDFNSTVDHQLAQGFSCADAAYQAGSGAVGTWPASTPALLAAPIDRVLHDGEHYTGSDAAVVSVGDSDHRGLLVRLSVKK